MKKIMTVLALGISISTFFTPSVLFADRISNAAIQDAILANAKREMACLAASEVYIACLTENLKKGLHPLDASGACQEAYFDLVSKCPR